MKLFVWNNPYPVNYGGSCLYVLAETEVQAREQAASTVIAKFGDTWEGRIVSLAPLRQPDRVVEGPYAECYEHEE